MVQTRCCGASGPPVWAEVSPPPPPPLPQLCERAVVGRGGPTWSCSATPAMAQRRVGSFWRGVPARRRCLPLDNARFSGVSARPKLCRPGLPEPQACCRASSWLRPARSKPPGGATWRTRLSRQTTACTRLPMIAEACGCLSPPEYPSRLGRGGGWRECAESGVCTRSSPRESFRRDRRCQTHVLVSRLQ